MEITLALVATIKNDDNVFNISTLVCDGTWITNFGASNHMTSDSTQVKKLKNPHKNCFYSQW